MANILQFNNRVLNFNNNILIYSTTTNYDPDVILWNSLLSTPASPLFLTNLSVFVNQLKLDNNWDKLDRLWIYAAETQEQASLDLKARQFHTEMNNPTWTNLQGYQGNSSDMFINTNYNPSVAINYQLNSACGFAYSTFAGTNGNVLFGAFDNSNVSTWLFPCYTPSGADSAIIYANNPANNSNIAGIADALGFYSVVRKDSSRLSLYKNSIEYPAAPKNSTAIPNLAIYVLAGNVNNTAAINSNYRAAVTGFGSGALDQPLLYTAIQNFATIIGFNV